jgi:GNAT superfamily N-acetyltransferase
VTRPEPRPARRTRADDAVAIRLLGPADDDRALAGHVAALINTAYRATEAGIWRDGTTRTNAAEVGRLIAAGEIAVAARDDRLAGAVRIRDVPGDASEFGMLAAAPDEHGTGVGRALLDFAEERARARGLRAMRLELLVPRTWKHPSKEFLKAWYGRRGYRLVHTTTLDEGHPHLAPRLATPCLLEVHEKPLRS